MEEKTLALQIMPMPADANPHGDIFGGWLMSNCDIAGSVPACQLAKGRVSTVAVNNFIFKEPVYIGDLVSFYATVTKVGNTSITVDVEVYALRNRFGDTPIKVTQATFVYVAIDENRKPRSVNQG